MIYNGCKFEGTDMQKNIFIVWHIFIDYLFQLLNTSL